MSALTTNDVRVLRLLVERGPHTAIELIRALERTCAGGRVAALRLPSLEDRGLVADERPSPTALAVFDITGEGARQLRRADEAAYGRWA